MDQPRWVGIDLQSLGWGRLLQTWPRRGHCDYNEVPQVCNSIGEGTAAQQCGAAFERESGWNADYCRSKPMLSGSPMPGLLIILSFSQLPAVGDLRNPSLKDRHWSMLEKTLGFKLTELSTPLTLGQLKHSNAFEKADEIREIAGMASSEASLEALLRKVCAWE